MRRFMITALLLALPLSASAAVLNADFEDQPGPKFSSCKDWQVGLGGGWADHATFAAPNNGTLGLNFGFYSVDLNQMLGQVTTDVFAPNTIYTFSTWAIGGGGSDVTIPYEIGYLSGGTSVANNFVLLAGALNVAPGRNAGGAWGPMAGVTYTTGASGPEIGLPIVIRLGGVNQGGAGGGGAWVDNASLTIIPEPAGLALLAVGLLALRRR